MWDLNFLKMMRSAVLWLVFLSPSAWAEEALEARVVALEQELSVRACASDRFGTASTFGVAAHRSDQSAAGAIRHRSQGRRCESGFQLSGLYSVG